MTLLLPILSLVPMTPCLSDAIPGQHPIKVSSGSHAELRISVEFQKTDIHEAIRFFAKATGRNFVIADGVSGTVSARLIDVPWTDALRAILATKGLVAVDMGSLVMIK